jgi:ParB-like chromosome segregation protein Spo0J
VNQDFEWLPLADIIPWSRNPRKNDGRPVADVAASIRRFGFVAPIVVWTSRRQIVAGHTRLKALRSILKGEPDFAPRGAPGPGLAPVRYQDFASEEEAAAYAIADNRLGELAIWDDALLKQVLAEVNTEGLGWNKEELDALLSEEKPEHAPAPSVEAMAGTFAVLVTCKSELQQRELLEEFAGREIECRAWNL